MLQLTKETVGEAAEEFHGAAKVEEEVRQTIHCVGRVKSDPFNKVQSKLDYGEFPFLQDSIQAKSDNAKLAGEYFKSARLAGQQHR